MYNNLRDFIKALEEKKDLIRIKEEVSTVLEMTEIHRRVLSNKGPAIIFENVVKENGKSSIPVLVNLFGTIERIALGLNINPDGLRDLGKLLAFLQSPEPPKNFKDAIKMFPLLKVVLSMRSKVVNKAPCQEVVLTGDEVDLSLLPIQTCWPNEPAPLITWPIVVTKGPTEDKQDNFNLGIYRMQVIDKKTTLMRWLAHRGGAGHHKRWKEKEQNMKFPAAAVIGSDPATIIAAVTPVPETLSEYQFAGLLRKKPLELVNCKTIPLQVPAHAEIVLEGYVSLDRYQDEGPYGDHTGYYNSVEQFPEFNITAITMRKNPIYLSTFTGKPPDEPSILGEALNEIFVPILINQFPEIVDFYLPPEGCSYRIAVISIEKSYPGQAKRIVMGILSFLKQFLYTKFIIVVDDDINVRDWKEVMWAISTRMDPVHDTIMIENAPIDYLDFASPESGLGGKMGFDATNKIPPETKQEWGEKIEMSKEIVRKVNEIFVPILINQFPEIVDFYLPPEGCSYRIAVISIKKSYPEQAKRIVMGVLSFLKQFLYTKFIIVVDDDINVRDWKEVMWAISTRMDPVHDTIMIENAPIDYLDFASPESGLGGKMGFDATNKIPPETKREWGEKIEMSEEIVRRIMEKWEEYGLTGN